MPALPSPFKTIRRDGTREDIVARPPSGSSSQPPKSRNPKPARDKAGTLVDLVVKPKPTNPFIELQVLLDGEERHLSIRYSDLVSLANGVAPR